MTEVVIELDNVQRYYEDFQALKGISLQVKKGQIFGYLGPNGSGKTTTIKLILGLIRPSSGKVRVLGEYPYPDTAKAMQMKAYMGSMLEFNGLFENLTGLENLVFWAGLYSINKKCALKMARRVISYVKLDEWADVPVSKYSYGMKKRLTLARALVSDPDVLILDEPTLGVDPESRYLIRNIINELAGKGKTIFFSSHDLEEVQKICSNVAIIKEGKLIFNGPLKELISYFRKSKLFIRLESSDMAENLAQRLKNKGYEIKLEGPVVSFYLEKDFDIWEFSEIGVIDSWKVKLSLEEAYLKMVTEEYI